MSERLRIDVLEQGLREAKEAAEKASGLLREQQLAVDRLDEEVRLLERLISLRDGTGDVLPVEVQPLSPGGGQPSSRRGKDLTDWLTDCLVQLNRPAHISEIMVLLQEHRIPIPGSGTQANVISYLRRDPRFTRISRGVYALVTTGEDESRLPVVKPFRRKRRTRRRRKVKR